MKTIQELAEQYYQEFETVQREDGSSYYRRKNWRNNTSGDLLYELCRNARNDMPQDDYKYEFIIEVLAIIADSACGFEEEAHEQVEANYYTSALTHWLHSDVHRIRYLDDALSEFQPCDGFQLLALAQKAEKDEVFYSVLADLEKIIKDNAEREP